MKVRDKEPADLDAAFKAALRIEACIKSLDVEERIPRPRKARGEDRSNRQMLVNYQESRRRMEVSEQQVSNLQKQSEEFRCQRETTLIRKSVG